MHTTGSTIGFHPLFAKKHEHDRADLGPVTRDCNPRNKKKHRSARSFTTVLEEELHIEEPSYD